MASSSFIVILVIGGAAAAILLLIGIFISVRGAKDDEQTAFDTAIPDPGAGSQNADAAGPSVPASQQPFAAPFTEAFPEEAAPDSPAGLLDGLPGGLPAGVRPLVKKCPYCAQVVAYEATHCKYCRQPLPAGPSIPGQASRSYAGFWSRVGASILDSILLSVGGAVIGTLVGFAWGALFGSEDASMTTLQCSVYAVSVIFAWLYAAGFESSARQATPGKMAVGIRVTDLKGQRLSFGKATARYICKFFSGLVFGIGYLMVAWDEKKQALHDKMAGTLVVRG
jgi:uncharacterized RDD family membrane protein YckC